MGDRITLEDRKLIAVAGGMFDFYTDPFGYVYDICNVEEEGLTLKNRSGSFLHTSIIVQVKILCFFYIYRQMVIHSHINGREIAKKGNKYPRFTKTGIKKTKAPKVLFGDVRDWYLLRKKRNKWKREDCSPGMTKYSFARSLGHT